MKKINIVDASNEASKNENSELAFQILDQLDDPYLFVFFNSIDQVGQSRHSWAWDVVEDWQNN